MNAKEQNALDRLKVHVVSLNPDTFIPETVYHYTSSIGLHGILSDGVLRASNFSYLNDSSEIIYGFELARDVIQKYISKNKLSINIKNFFKAVCKSLENIGKGIEIYLACFCNEPDLLSQWRGYGTMKGRYCIGFRTEELPNKPQYNLSRVIYKKAEQEAILEKEVTRAVSVITGRHTREFYISASDIILKNILGELWRFKDQGFHEEKEWRVSKVSNSIDDIKFEPSEGLIKPYINIWKGEEIFPSCKTLPICEIYIGTSSFVDKSLKSIELMLSKFKYKNVEVKKSIIPFQELE
jgi:hypothetical protein